MTDSGAIVWIVLTVILVVAAYAIRMAHDRKLDKNREKFFKGYEEHYKDLLRTDRVKDDD